MVEVRNLNIKLRNSDRYLLKNFNLILNNKDKAAIIGEEGNGKTTFIKSLISNKDILEYVDIKGIINVPKNIGYLEQSLNELWLERELREFFLKDNPDLNENYEIYDDYKKTVEVFNSLRLDLDLLESERKISTFSGGEKVKFQLAKIMIKNPEFLILDEPTNDLDIETLEFLEDFINNTDIPILYVSHDETLLENTANTIIHLEQLKRKTDVRNTVSKISYKDYVEDRKKRIEKSIQEHNSETKIKKESLKKLNKIKDKIVANNPERQNQLRSLIAEEKRLEKDSVTEKIETEDQIFLKISDIEEIPNSKVILDMHLDVLEVDEKNLANNIDITLIGKEKLVILGKNGSGKTTLLKKILERLKQTPNIKVGYMPQNYDEVLKNYSKVLDFLSENNEESITRIRSLLGMLKFTSEEMLNDIYNLSGGQKAKIFLLKMFLDKSNVLVLDEPTRNLSPLSNPVIRNILKEYPGSIISVSHDRKYIDEVCDKKIFIKKDK
jgi:ABC transporter, ATP-binding protein